MDDDILALLAEQADQIARLQADVSRLHGTNGALAEERDNLAARLELATKGEASGPDDYWSNVYDRIFDAWAAFALAELGTRTPSAHDLAGRPELLALYDSIC